MQKVDLLAVNLNLLVVLDVLLEEKHVSKTAERLNVAQSKVSRDLKKIRETFKDQILVSTANGYALSERAEALQPELKIILGKVENLLNEKVFNPLTSELMLKFHSPSVQASLFLQPFFNELRQSQSRLGVSISSQPEDPFALLDSGDVHFAICEAQPDFGGDHFYSRLLGRSPYVAVVSEASQFANQQLTIEGYQQAQHAEVERLGGNNHVIEHCTYLLGFERQKIARFVSNDMAAKFCEESDLMLTLPQLLAEHLMKKFNLTYCCLPRELSIPPCEFRLYWHARFHNQPLCEWSRSKIRLDSAVLSS